MLISKLITQLGGKDQESIRNNIKSLHCGIINLSLYCFVSLLYDSTKFVEKSALVSCEASVAPLLANPADTLIIPQELPLRSSGKSMNYKFSAETKVDELEMLVRACLNSFENLEKYGE